MVYIRPMPGPLFSPSPIIIRWESVPISEVRSLPRLKTASQSLRRRQRTDSETGELCRNLPGGGYRAGMTPHTPPGRRTRSSRVSGTLRQVESGRSRAPSGVEGGARGHVSNWSTPQGTPRGGTPPRTASTPLDAPRRQSIRVYLAVELCPRWVVRTGGVIRRARGQQI
jgi:hypothetical protein